MYSDYMQIKKCPVCGEKFECLHNENCWCVHIKLSEETINYLENNYNDCLCKNCLEKIEKQINS